MDFLAVFCKGGGIVCPERAAFFVGTSISIDHDHMRTVVRPFASARRERREYLQGNSIGKR